MLKTIGAKWGLIQGVANVQTTSREILVGHWDIPHIWQDQGTYTQYDVIINNTEQDPNK